MKRRAKTMRVWVWRGSYGKTLLTARREPVYEWETWNDPADEEHWYDGKDRDFQMWLLGLKSLPPRGTAWLVEVTAPGKSRVVKRMRGGE